MRHIIVISHGTMAKGTCEAARLICGDLKDVSYLCLENGMGISTFKENLSNLLDDIKECDQIIVLCDLKGGSPYSTVLALLYEKKLFDKSKVITGLNLPMLLTIIFIKGELDAKKEEELINTSKDGISIFKMTDNEEDIL